MIGNDIVDLALANKETNWKRKGFLDKIFTVKEQVFITTAENPERMVWNLWSRKEAAYKIYHRQTQIRLYNPIQFECCDINLSIGKVSFKDFIYFVKTEQLQDFIYTIAVTEKSDFNKIIRLPENTKITKHKTIPSYFDEINCLLKPVSITHHGRFKRKISLD